MDKEAGPEGAEVPNAAPAAGGKDKVSMDYKCFWRELGDALGMQPGILSNVLTAKAARVMPPQPEDRQMKESKCKTSQAVFLC